MKIALIILAGGRGVRLRPLTFFVPKPLMPIVGGRRLIDFSLDATLQLSKHPDVVVVPMIMMGRHANQVTNYVTKKIRQTWIPFRSPVHSGTGYGIKLHQKIIFSEGVDIIIVLPTDQAHAVNLRDLVECHIDTKKAVTLVCVESFSLRHDYVHLVGKRVCGLRPGPTRTSAFAYTGIVVFTSAVLAQYLDLLNDGAAIDLTQDVVRPLLNRNDAGMYHEKNYWEDLGTWPRYVQFLVRGKSYVKGEYGENLFTGT